MKGKAPDQIVDLVAHRIGPPPWVLPLLLILALACIALSLIIPTSDWTPSPYHCPKIGCIFIEPLFNLLPNGARRLLVFLLGLFFYSGYTEVFCRGLKSLWL